MFLAIMSNAAINTHVQVFMWTYVFTSLGHIPKRGIAGLYGKYLFNFLTSFSPKSLYHFLFPSEMYASQLPHLCQHHSGGSVVLSHCGFELCFLMISDSEHLLNLAVCFFDIKCLSF